MLKGEDMKEGNAVSTFGRYHGGESEFDSYTRSSAYLSLQDGTRLAYDLLLPARGSVSVTRPVPTLFKYTPYLRTFTIFDKRGKNVIAGLFKLSILQRAMLRLRLWLAGEKGRFMDPVFRTPWLKSMLRHGYAVIVVERPGTGASFGTMDPTMEVGGREAAEIIDWIASRPWCDGNVGMFGDSFQAMIQFAAAAQGRRALKAIMPASSYINGYEAIMYPGGIYNKAFGSFFRWAVDFMESDVITPVDGNDGGELLTQARADRRAAFGSRIIEGTEKFPFRDDVTKDGRLFWKAGDLYPFIERINASGTAVYLSVGWFDLFTQDMFLWYENLTVPKRLTVRPIDHSGADKSGPDLDYAAEALRWFDYWLKGMPNEVMDEASLHYYEMASGRLGGWRSSDRWPVQEAQSVEHFLAAPASQSAEGSLETQIAEVARCSEIVVSYATTTGTKSRWTAVNWARRYPDMTIDDAKGFSFATAPLASDLVVCGNPVARIWLSTSAPDLDLFVYLEELDSCGRSTYITEGQLRLSHRKTADAPYAHLGLPFRSHLRSDVEPVPTDVPVLAELALLPTCYRFKKGSRVRLALRFADADNFDTPVLTPAPRVRVLTGADHGSALTLPLRGDAAKASRGLDPS